MLHAVAGETLKLHERLMKMDAIDEGTFVCQMPSARTFHAEGTAMQPPILLQYKGIDSFRPLPLRYAREARCHFHRYYSTWAQRSCFADLLSLDSSIVRMFFGPSMAFIAPGLIVRHILFLKPLDVMCFISQRASAMDSFCA